MSIRLSLEEIVERVPIPELTEKLPGDRLVEFYKKLGWDGESEIDPNKVKLHTNDLEKLYAREIEHARSIYPDASPVEINLTIGMLWANKGPSGYGSTPGMVELYPGWEIKE